MKTTALIIALSLSSCATGPDGSKTFLGLNASAWSAVGRDAAQAAGREAVVSYGTRRAVNSAKNPVLVLP